MTTEATKPKNLRIAVRLLGLILIAYGALADFHSEWLSPIIIVLGLLFLITGKGIL